MTNRTLKALCLAGALACITLGSQVLRADEREQGDRRYELTTLQRKRFTVVDRVAGRVYVIDFRRKLALEFRHGEGKLLVKDLRSDLELKPLRLDGRVRFEVEDTRDPDVVALFDPVSGRIYLSGEGAAGWVIDPVEGAFVELEEVDQRSAASKQQSLVEASEEGAIQALRVITSAQSLFREGDKEQDMNFDYGTLRELSDCGLIDAELGSGSKFGYVFQVEYSTQTSEFLWFATASPQVPGGGMRHFCLNQAGVVYWRFDAPFEMDNVTCEIPEGALGR